MTIRQYMAKHKLPDSYEINNIAVIHPKSGKKIHILARWFSGFWYRKKPGRGDGQMWPCQYRGDLLDLEVFDDDE